MSTKQNPLVSELCRLLEDLQGIDVQIIDVKKQTAITDYMIIASGRASRHVKAMAENIMDSMKKSGHPALSCTGLDTGDWVLLDFNEVIVHLMQSDARYFYNLEALWQGNVKDKNNRTGS